MWRGGEEKGGLRRSVGRVTVFWYWVWDKGVRMSRWP